MTKSLFPVGTDLLVETMYGSHRTTGAGQITVAAMRADGRTDIGTLPYDHAARDAHMAALVEFLGDPVHITEKYSNDAGTVRTFDVTL